MVTACRAACTRRARARSTPVATTLYKQQRRRVKWKTPLTQSTGSSYRRNREEGEALPERWPSFVYLLLVRRVSSVENTRADFDCFATCRAERNRRRACPVGEAGGRVRCEPGRGRVGPGRWWPGLGRVFESVRTAVECSFIGRGFRQYTKGFGPPWPKFG